MKLTALALVVSTSTAPLNGITLDLYRELSAQVARGEALEARLDVQIKRSAALQAALKECEERPPELPGWFWPVVGVAAGMVGAGFVAIGVSR